MIQFLNTSLVMTVVSLLALACSSPKTSYSNQQRVAAEKNKKITQNENATLPDSNNSASAEQVKAPLDPVATGVPIEKSQECWFAVSGTYVGLGDYEDTFPIPSSKKPIATGEKFDTVGGVFLAARPEPYIYKQGQGEIDSAVDYTFDGIVVPPGMSVEIKSSEISEPIYKGQGPLIAIAGRAEGTGYGSPYTYKQKHDAGELKHWPQWMQDYLRNSGGKVEIIATHPARWVKVSVVEGGRCAE